MYEKYVWLEANKPFALIENKGGQKTFYGAELAEYNFGYDENDPNCKNFADNPNMIIQQGKLIVGENAPKMQVKEEGLYHIILDNNTAGDLPDGAQIVIQKADFGVRGGMNGWGFTKGEVKKADDGTITYTWKDQNLAKGGEFKYASCWGWKINLDLDNKVKAEVSLGLDKSNNFTNVDAGNIKVEKAGLYDITHTEYCSRLYGDALTLEVYENHIKTFFLYYAVVTLRFETAVVSTLSVECSVPVLVRAELDRKSVV